MEVFDGSEGDKAQTSGGKWYRTSVTEGATQFVYNEVLKKVGYNTSICDKFLNTGNADPFTTGKRKAFTYTDHPNLSCMYFNFGTSDTSMQEWLTWLSQNPTTIVYGLAEPYYEPIEPQLSQYSFSAVKDGDMEIITVLPIEKVNLTYRTDINGVSSIEEQIASIQEGTDISSIIDEEVDE